RRSVEFPIAYRPRDWIAILSAPLAFFFFSSRRRHTRSVSAFLLNRSSDLTSQRSGARPGRPQPLRGTKGKRKGARLWYVGGQQRSEERRVGKSVDLGGGRDIKKKNRTKIDRILICVSRARRDQCL